MVQNNRQVGSSFVSVILNFVGLSARSLSSLKVYRYNPHIEFHLQNKPLCLQPYTYKYGNL
jgi:hypothetical protein